MAIGWKCQGCGIIRETKWMGRCVGCYGFYNIKQAHTDLPGAELGMPSVEGQVMSLCDVTAVSMERISTGVPGVDNILGFDRILGTWGIATSAGHIIQIYGGPGAGKSTLLLQICRGITAQRHPVLYIAGEESLEQIKDRADRIGKFNSKMQIIKEHDLDAILDAIDEHQPKVCIVDSINTITVGDYDTGSMAAITPAARDLVNIAKDHGIGLFIVVQITKGGDFSGPKSLEHLVDTSIFLKSLNDQDRVLECHSKNRLNKTPVNAYFTMTENGLVGIKDPTEESVTSKEIISSPPIEQVESIPLDVVSDEKLWVAPDGTSATTVLAVKCDVEDCKGKIDVACTSASGKREAGFHTSRVTKAKLKLEDKIPKPENNIAVESDPFTEKTLTAKPRRKNAQTKRKSSVAQ